MGADAHPLAIAIYYGLVSTLRALLRQGHDPDQKLAYGGDSTVVGGPFWKPAGSAAPFTFA